MARRKGEGVDRKARRAEYEARRAAKQRPKGPANIIKYGGGGLAAAALLSFVYTIGVGVMTEHIATFDPSGEGFRQALTSGEPWLVLCHNGTGEQPHAFVDSQSLLSGVARLGVVDCDARITPSASKTVMQRLKLRNYPRPVAFVTGNGRPPQQVPFRLFKDAEKLAAWVTQTTKPRVKNIKSTEDFAACQGRKTCAVAMSPTGTLTLRQRDALRPMLTKHRKTQFAFLDTSRFAPVGADVGHIADGLGATVVAPTNPDAKVAAPHAVTDGFLLFRRVQRSNDKAAAMASDKEKKRSTESWTEAKHLQSLEELEAAMTQPVAPGWGVRLTTHLGVQKLQWTKPRKDKRRKKKKKKGKNGKQQGKRRRRKGRSDDDNNKDYEGDGDDRLRKAAARAQRRRDRRRRQRREANERERVEEEAAEQDTAQQPQVEDQGSAGAPEEEAEAVLAERRRQRRAQMDAEAASYVPLAAETEEDDEDSFDGDDAAGNEEWEEWDEEIEL